MSEGPPKWSEVSDDEASRYLADPGRRVALPGAALIVLGSLGIVVNVLLALGLNAIRQAQGPAQRPDGLDEKTYKAYERGQAAAPLVDCCLVSVPTLAIYPLVIVAGARMRQVRNRGLAITGAVLAMAPCSPVILLGIPIGDWSLVVMADPAVRAAFVGQRHHR